MQLNVHELAGFWWNNQTSPAPYTGNIQFEQYITHYIILWEANKNQRVETCFSIFSQHHNIIAFDRVLASDETWVVYKISTRFISHHGTLCIWLQNQLFTYSRACFLSVGLVPKRCISSFYHRVKPSLRIFTHTLRNMCNRRWSI